MRAVQRTLAALAVGFALLFATPVSAQFPGLVWEWRPWSAIGGGSTDWPAACTSTNQRELSCLAVDAGGAIRRAVTVGGASDPLDAPWTSWGVVGQMQLTQPPSCVDDHDNVVQCFLAGSFTTAGFPFFARAFVGNVPAGAWSPLSGAVGSHGYSCFSPTSRLMTCYARSWNSRLIRTSFDGNFWTAWAAPNPNDPGFEIIDGAGPSCAPYGALGQNVCVFSDRSVHILQAFEAAGGRYTSLPFTGVADDFVSGPPKCKALIFESRVVCFATIWQQSLLFKLGMWTYHGDIAWTFDDLGVYVERIRGANGTTTTRDASDIDCVLRSQGRIDCMALTNDRQGHAYMRHLQVAPAPTQAVNRFRLVGAGWRNGPTFNAGVANTPRRLQCLSRDDETIDCFASGGNSAVWRTTYVSRPANLGDATIAPGRSR